MKNKFKVLFTLLFFAYGSLPFGKGGDGLFSQDLHFSQPMQHALLLNPAAAGMGEGIFRATAGYKSQWASMDNPYRSMLASFDMPLLKQKKKMGYLGAGGYFYSDRSGDSRMGSSSANASLAAIVPLNEQSSLSTGFNLGYIQRSATMTNLQWPGQYNGQTYDPGISSNEVNLFNSFSFLDMSAGVFYQFLKNSGNIQGKDMLRINAGVAYFHLNSANYTFYSGEKDPLYGKLLIHASARYDLPQTKIGLVPSLMYMSQGPATELNAGFSLRYRLSEATKVTGFKTESALSAGLMYRANNAIIPQVLLEIANFGIGLSYDVNIASLSQAARKGGGLEISLRYAHVRDAVFQGKK